MRLELKFGSFNGGDHGKHKGDDFVEISEISEIQDKFFYGAPTFDGSTNLLYRQRTWSGHDRGQVQVITYSTVARQALEYFVLIPDFPLITEGKVWD